MTNGDSIRAMTDRELAEIIMCPYDGCRLMDIPLDVVKKAQEELDKARAAGQEWNRRNGIRLKGRINDEKMHR